MQISDKAVLLWILSCAGVTIVASIASAVIVYLIHGCWAMSSALISSNCLARVGPWWLAFVPIAVGFVGGTALCARLLRSS